MVTATDEAELARQMERAEAENAEVAGDSAEEDEDHGTHTQTHTHTLYRMLKNGNSKPKRRESESPIQFSGRNSQNKN